MRVSCWVPVPSADTVRAAAARTLQCSTVQHPSAQVPHTRCGELLKAIQPSKGGYAPIFNAQEGALPSVTREDAAEDAGLSERQVRQVSVAKITQAGYRHAAAWCALSKPHRAQIGGISGGICENRRGQNLAKSIR